MNETFVEEKSKSGPKFQTLPLGNEIIANLEALGFEFMTPIQSHALPLILEGKDIVAQAKTGSGKTAAFALGILSRLNGKDFRPQALVLCPTRELAEQVTVEIRRLASFTKNIKVLLVCGGTAEYFQTKSLDHGAHIIVGTPGRLLKLLKTKVINLEMLNTLVFDEADRMLDMGFCDDIRAITSFAPKKRQTLLFSATYPDEILALSSDLQNNPTQISVDSKHQQHVIKQIFYRLSGPSQKLDALPLLLGHYKPASSVIFCKTKQSCQEVAAALVEQGIAALAIHGDLEQRERTLILNKFSNKSCLVLVATDVAARGLDIKDLQMVINYDLPTDPESYVHRIGRTGRAGKEGVALSLFTKQENFKLEEIAKYLGIENSCEDISLLSPDKKFDLLPPMRTMLIYGGRKDKLRPGDILGALTGDVGLKKEQVGGIHITDVLSYVAIDSLHIETVVTTLQSGKIKGRKFKVTLAP
ncbi:MAG: ATP-dependent RNA helicase DbpA [Oligoflexia bacterium]|nr:ATP-dependent RNA helicase DbpA [Oligoflexia bacterium]